MTKNKALICTIIASVLFGFIPLSVSLAYTTGLTALDVLFFRFFFAGGLFFIFLKITGKNLKITKRQAVLLVIMGLVGYSFMNLTLFLSYTYIPVGLATTIHFSYPIIVTILSFFIYKQKLNKHGIFALVLASVGILLLSIEDLSINNGIGIILAFLSAVFFSVYALLIAHPDLDEMNIWKILFYVSVVTIITVYIEELFMMTTPFERITFEGAFHCMILAVINTVVSVSLFTIGIKWMGPAIACILATLEPITSIILGIVILNEEFTLYITAGCLLVIFAVVLITMPQKNKNNLIE